MQTYSSAADKREAARSTTTTALKDRRWDLAFVGILAYLFVEYTSLPQMYPILQPLRLGKVVVLFAVIGWLTSGNQGNDAFRSRRMDVAFVAFLCACLLSALFARDVSQALSGFLDVLRWGVIYFLISRILTSEWRLRIFVLFLMLLCLKLSQFEVRSYIGERAFGRSEMFVSMHGEGAGSTSFFGNGGDFGVAMCVVWPLAGSLLFGETKKLTRLFLLGCFVAFLISIFLCGSRGAIVGAAAIAVAAWAKQPKRIFGVLTVLLLVAGSFYILPEATKERLRPTLHMQQDETSQMRMNLWRAGISMFEGNPIFGVGLYNFGDVFRSDYGGSISTPAVNVPHSIYVQALSETGLVGTAPLLALWVLFLRMNSQTRKHLSALGLANRKSFEYRLSIGLDLAFIGYMVSGAFITVLFYPHLWCLLGLCSALHGICLRKKQQVAPAKAETHQRHFALATNN